MLLNHFVSVRSYCPTFIVVLGHEYDLLHNNPWCDLSKTNVDDTLDWSGVGPCEIMLHVQIFLISYLYSQVLFKIYADADYNYNM